MDNLLFENGLKIKLLYDHLILQSKTPRYRSYNGGIKGNVATLETIRNLYKARGTDKFNSYNEATADERKQFDLFSIEVLGTYLNVVRIWNDFKDDIINNNRYFVKDEIRRLLEGFKDKKMFLDNTILTFYRARIGDFVDLDDFEMLAPPKNKASAGRCNPEGISYLYLASNKNTAIREVRANKGDAVTVAKIDVDVSSVYSFIKYLQEYKYWFKANEDTVNELVALINEEFSSAINLDNKNNYIPLQYISEFVKHIGYDGFIFSSALGKGFNLVMFNWENKINVLSKEMFVVDNIESVAISNDLKKVNYN